MSEDISSLLNNLSISNEYDCSWRNCKKKATLTNQKYNTC